nr:hypothetical protein Iba_chr12cCG4860 [Ipomoea batatas]
MTAGALSSCPIPAPEEEASLFWSRLLNHAFAALHPTETVRVNLSRWNVKLSSFLRFVWGDRLVIEGELPRKRLVGSLIHECICDRELEASVHE